MDDDDSSPLINVDVDDEPEDVTMGSCTSSQKNQSQQQMEMEEEEGLQTAAASAASPDSSQPAKKKQRDEFNSDDEDAAAAERAEAAAHAAAAHEQLLQLRRAWMYDDPHVNVELPYPSKTDRCHFCWYDLGEEWREDRMPSAVPKELVNSRFRYNDKAFIDLPFADRTDSDGLSHRPRKELIEEALRSFAAGCRDLDHLESGIRSYYKGFRANTLRMMVKDGRSAELDAILAVISKTAALALKETKLVTRALPKLLCKGSVRSVSMSQEQAGMLLAFGFFCTFVPKGRRDNYNTLTFAYIHLGGRRIFQQKMAFILAYFKQVTDDMPRGTLTFSRNVWDFREEERKGYDKWTEPLADLYVTAEGLIEQQEGCLQVDFANEYIGGGVMNEGAVQEEIRFLCCPEMLVSLLLAERMDANEAILIQGAQQYSEYRGYASTLEHVPMAVRRDEPRDKFGRARSYLVAIDAICYQRPDDQFNPPCIARETKKAIAGFKLARPSAPARPIATGNWGCGVFNGNKQLKSLIQLIAASHVGRPMIYITFKDQRFAEELTAIYQCLKGMNVNNGQLYHILVNYATRTRKDLTVFQFVAGVIQQRK